MRFRIVERDAMGNRGGPHSQGPVKHGGFSEHYVAGQIVESDRPLDELFRGKFERLGSQPEPEAKRTGRK